MNRDSLPVGLVGLALVAMSSASALAVTGASANYASQLNGSTYTYDLLLKNTGDTPLRTFWFAWAPPFYSFLPSIPDTTSSPSGWTAQVVPDYFGYGYSILWNTTGSGVAPGASLTGFEFTSVDTPADLQASNYYYGLPNAFSYVYASTVNADDALPSQFGAFTAVPGPVPEPASAGLLFGAASLVTLGRRRK